MEIIKLRDEYIKLGQALKAANLVEDGVEAKLVIQDGLVKVNNQVDIRRGRKLYDGDVVSFDGQGSGNDRSTASTSFRSHVNNIICGLDDVKVMFDNNNRISALAEPPEYIHKPVNISKMKSRGRLIKYIYCLSCSTP